MNTKTMTLTEQMPAVLRELENGLRAGYNLLQAFEIVSKDVPAPAGAAAQALIEEVKQGVAFPQALNNLVQQTQSQEIDLLVATCLVQFETGGNLADKFNLLGQILAKRQL